MASVLDLVSNASDGVCAVDQSQRIVLWNNGAALIMGFSADEALREHCFKIFAGRSESSARICRPMCGHIISALSQQVARTFELKTHHKSGKELWLSVSTIVVPSRWSNLSVLIHLFRGISEQKQCMLFARQLLATVSQLSSAQEKKLKPTFNATVDSLGLTQREAEVLRLLGAGTSTEKIAAVLAVRPATVRAHIQKILCKLGVHSRLEAVTLAIRNGLI